MKEARTEATRPTRRQRRVRSAAVLVPAALLAVAAGGFALVGSDEAVAEGVGCFETADLDGNVTILQTTGEDPVEMCTEQWTAGNLGYDGPAPALVACVNEPGAVYVLPSEDPKACVDLGLQELPEGYAREARRFAAMRDDAVRSVRDAARAHDDCLEAAETVAVVEEVLSRHGFDEWAPEVLGGDGYEGRPCANWLGFDDEEKTVQVIPSDAVL